MNKEEALDILNKHHYKYDEGDNKLKVKLRKKSFFIIEFSNNEIASYTTEIKEDSIMKFTYKGYLRSTLIGFFFLILICAIYYYLDVLNNTASTSIFFLFAFVFVYSSVIVLIYRKKINTLKKLLNLD